MTSHTASSSPVDVAVLGPGRMGAAIATRLTTHGHPVLTWSRSGRRIDGIPAARTAREAVSGAQMVLLCLYDAAACRDALAQVGDRLSSETHVVCTSTVGPDQASELAALVRATSATYVHAPVIGSVPAAAAGTLSVLVGAEKVSPDVETVLTALGDLLHCTDAAESAALKLVANGALAGALLSIRDSRAHSEQLGVTAEQAWRVLERTPLGAVVRGKRQRLSSADFSAADFTVSALVKDVDLLADRSPAAERLRTGLHSVLEHGRIGVEDDVAALCIPDTGSAQPAESPSLPHGLTIATSVRATAEVLEPLLAYATGHASGDSSQHRRAFLPTAHIEGLREGAFVSWTLDEYCDLFDGKPAEDESSRHRRVEQVRVTGSTGTAVMTLWHGESVFTDAFVLLRVDGEWRIANKAYHRETRAQSL